MKIIAIIFSAIFSTGVSAVEIASCSNPSGTAYYPELGLINKKDAGWKSDKINGGITKLSKLGGNDFDIIYVDATNRITSSKESGATVLLLNQGKSSISILVAYPGTLTEIYTFIKNNSGGLEYTHVSSRISDSVLISKASIMRGDCKILNLELL